MIERVPSDENYGKGSKDAGGSWPDKRMSEGMLHQGLNLWQLYTLQRVDSLPYSPQQSPTTFVPNTMAPGHQQSLYQDKVINETLYVNAEPFHRILKRRDAQKALEEAYRAVTHRPYMHKSRHNRAMRRPRGLNRRFLTKEEIAEIEAAKEKVAKGDSKLNRTSVPSSLKREPRQSRSHHRPAV